MSSTSSLGQRTTQRCCEFMDTYVLVLTGFRSARPPDRMAPYAAERAASVAPDRLFAIGALIFSVPGSGAAPHPQEHLSVAERLTEFVVLIALMGAGLKLDRPLAFATSGPTWRLLGIAMPLTIGALALFGQALLGLNAAAAMLLAAALALSIGGAVGWIVGRFLGWLIFRLPNRAKLSRTGDGFVALGVTCLAYGLTEVAHGYGFLAVFVAAVGIRSAERNHSYHEKLHDFV